MSFKRYHDADPLARGAVLSDPEAHRARNFPAFERDELALVAELDIAMFAGKRLAYYLLYPVVGEVGGDVLSVKRAYMIRIVAQQLAFSDRARDILSAVVYAPFTLSVGLKWNHTVDVLVSGRGAS